MRITWKDGVTTLAAAGAVAIERAHAFEWSWPLVESMRWSLIGVAIMFGIGLLFGYYLDTYRSETWTTAVGISTTFAILLFALGFVFESSAYLVLLMINTLAFWLGALIKDLALDSEASQHNFGI